MEEEIYRLMTEFLEKQETLNEIKIGGEIDGNLEMLSLRLYS